jgi:hypothetical protein
MHSGGPGKAEPVFDQEYLTKLGLVDKIPAWLEKYSNLDESEN